jgi:hypothetical protein
VQITKVTVGLSMKVQPVRFEPFDVHVGAEAALNEKDDPREGLRQVRDLVSNQLEEAIREEVSKFYGPGSGERALAKAKEA